MYAPFAAAHTGLRPFCELARLAAEDVEEAPQGMMWRVHSSKTDKTREVPVHPEVAELTRRVLTTAPRVAGGDGPGGSACGEVRDRALAVGSGCASTGEEGWRRAHLFVADFSP
jgi:integrase